MESLLKSLLIYLSFFLYVPNSLGESPTPESLYEKYKKAVVKIDIMHHGVLTSSGTGFFISSNGVLVTNEHVILKALSEPGFSVEFSTHNGKKTSSYQISSCGDKRFIDLCILKLPWKPSVWFEKQTGVPKHGERVYVIGHPYGLDFSISDGIVSGVRQSKSTPLVSMVQVTAPISPGSSGGPIFNSRGDLLGIATERLKKGENLGFGILNKEIFEYVSKHSNFMDAQSYIAIHEKGMQSFARDMHRSLIDPALVHLRTQKSLESFNQYFKERIISPSARYSFFLPKIYKNCKNEGKSIFCPFTSSSGRMLGAVSVSVLSWDEKLKLDTKLIKKVFQPEPLPIVESLKKRNLWKKTAKGLTSERKRALFSYLEKVRCNVKLKEIGSTSWMKNRKICSFLIYNHKKANGVSFNYYVHLGEEILWISSWSASPSYVGFLFPVAGVALHSASRVKTVE